MSLVNFLVKALTVVTTFLGGRFGYDEKSFYVKNLLESLAAIPTIEQDILQAELVALRDISARSFGEFNEDANLNISQLVNKYGYKFEEHDVETKDGYIVTLHRIPNSGPVVYLVHGILQASDDFVTAGPDSALAYYLASRGYDVWMFNARGNKHSKRHVFLSPGQDEFWNFSWDEIGRFDLPVTIDYILSVTGAKKINYVGFSQGNTSFYILCSEFPEYNEKINVQISLAPVAFFSHTFSPVLRFLYKIELFKYLMATHQNDFFPDEKFLSAICINDNRIVNFLCTNLLFLTFGYDRGEFNITNFPVVFKHTPSGCAAKQFEHYRQSLYSGRFRQYDYGTAKNLQLYGSNKPPAYQLNKVTAPVALFYSKSDYFCSFVDVVTLRKRLGNVVDFYECMNFGHLDYQLGRDINEVVNKRVLQIIRQFS